MKVYCSIRFCSTIIANPNSANTCPNVVVYIVETIPNQFLIRCKLETQTHPNKFKHMQSTPNATMVAP